jgi:hypothetical protein
MTTAEPTKTKKPFSLQFLFSRPEKPYIHPYLGGVLLGIVLFLAFFFTRNGLGASGGLNRLIAAAEDLVVPGHIDLTPYLLKLAGGEKNPLDDWSVPVVIGALIGGFTSGFLNGRLKVEINKGPRISNRTRLIRHSLVGRLWHTERAWHAAAPRARRSRAGLPCLPAPGR